MNEKNGFKTPVELEKERRRKEMCRVYLKFRADYPELSPSRIMRVMAEQYFGCTEQNVRYALTKEGVYIKRRK